MTNPQQTYSPADITDLDFDPIAQINRLWGR